MGIVGLGSGIFGYLGPQMLGYLRDATGGFTAGWVFVACAAVLSLCDLLMLRGYSAQAASFVYRRDTSSHEQKSHRWHHLKHGSLGDSTRSRLHSALCSRMRLDRLLYADRFMEDVFDRRIRVDFRPPVCGRMESTWISS